MIIIYLIYFKIKQTILSGDYMNKKFLYAYTFIFLIMSLLLGKLFNFYEIIPRWDKILHFYSGFVLYKWGVYFYLKINRVKTNTPLMIIFGVLFSFSCALLWEVWEFAGDSLFNLNSQNNSLHDTMWDMIMGCTGGIVSVIFHNKTGE